MPFCPNCRYEYEEGVTLCPDCDVELVRELPPLYEDIEPVVVYYADDELTANMLKTYLEDNGIEAYVNPSGIPMHPGVLDGWGGSYWGQIVVEEHNFHEARELIKDYLENVKPLEDEEE